MHFLAIIAKALSEKSNLTNSRCADVYQLYEKYKSPIFKLFHKYKGNDYIFIIPFVILSLKVRLQYFFFLNSPGQSFPQSEDSIWYINYANNLMATFKIGTHMDDILYFGYNILLTVLLAIFKDPIDIIFIQATTAGLCVILVYKIARMLFNKITAIVAAYFYCYYSWGITLWSTYILADSFFISLLLVCVYFLLMFMESQKRRYKILFMATLLYMLVFKPTGIVSVGLIMVFIITNLRRKAIFAYVAKHRLVIGGMITALVAFGMFLYIGGQLDPLISSMQFNAKKVLYNIYAKGWIYDRASAHDHFYRPDYTIDIGNSLIVSFIVNNWDHIAVVYGKRTIAFIGRWVWEIDLGSKRGMLRFAVNLLPVVLFAIGTVAALINGLFRKASIIWLMILGTFMFCILFFIDGMYRYRTPCIPFIAIVAAYGVDRAVHIVIGISRILANRLLNKEWKGKLERLAMIQHQTHPKQDEKMG
jgi:hypothetical protein